MAVERTGRSQRRSDEDNDELRARLQEAEETLRAIRSGEVDALIVSTEEGDRLFTLQGADHSYRALVERMNEGALSLTPDGMILYANQRFASMVKVPLEQVIGSTIHHWINQEDRTAMDALLQSGMRENCRRELQLLAADSSTVPVSLSLNRVPIDGFRDSLGAVATDLTEQKRAEEALRVSEAKLRNVFENSLLGKRLTSSDGQFQVNKAFCDILGYTEEELLAMPWEKITYPDDVPATREVYQRLQQGAASTVRMEKRYIHKDGSVVWADATFTAARDEAGNLLYTLVAINDVTARKQADAAVLDLKQHLQRNIEMERLRLAQDLHDVPLQELYAVIYELEQVRVASDEGTSLVIGQVIGNIQKTLNSLRVTASELRPPALSRFGLEKAVRSYIHDFSESNPNMQITAVLAHDGQTLPEDVRLILFRVVQESLANVLRHSGAAEVRVVFNFDAEEARIEITDNGKGFEVPDNWLEMVRAGHYGLAGMAERVESAGGVFQIESAPGQSTTVRAVLPYGSM